MTRSQITDSREARDRSARLSSTLLREIARWRSSPTRRDDRMFSLLLIGRDDVSVADWSADDDAPRGRLEPRIIVPLPTGMDSSEIARWLLRHAVDVHIVAAALTIEGNGTKSITREGERALRRLRAATRGESV